MPGPPKTPLRLKLLRGTLNVPTRNAPETAALPAIDAVPTPPRWLKNKDAVREWNRLAPLLTANGLLNQGNIGLLQQLCAVHGHLVLLWSTGAKANAALIATYRMLSNSLGLLGFDIQSAKPGNRFSKHARQLPTGAR